MIVILCFAYDSPVLDPKAEHFPRELVANAGTDVRTYRRDAILRANDRAVRGTVATECLHQREGSFVQETDPAMRCIDA